MLRTVQDATAKTLRNDSTSFINSALHYDAAYERMTDDEEIAAGVVSILYGPVVKVTTGVGMMVAGIAMTPIPKVVLNVKTKENENLSGDRIAEILDVNVATRESRTPTYFHRETIIQLPDDHIEKREEEGKFMTYNLNVITKPAGIVNDRNEFKLNKAVSETTVTGFSLFTTGLGRVFSGAIDPLRGLATVGYFGTKKAIEKYNEYKQSKPSDEIELRSKHEKQS